jgi:hypothetical protein
MSISVQLFFCLKWSNGEWSSILFGDLDIQKCQINHDFNLKLHALCNLAVLDPRFQIQLMAIP